MLEFLSEYAPVIIAVTVLAALVIILAKKGMEREAKAIVLSLVAAAEQRFGGGTGEIKYSAVAAALYERLPSAARILLDEKTISYLIEDAVKKLKNIFLPKTMLCIQRIAYNCYKKRRSAPFFVFYKLFLYVRKS